MSTYREGATLKRNAYNEIYSEAFASELPENLKEMFLGSTHIVMSYAWSNAQPHTSVLPVAKGFKNTKQYNLFPRRHHPQRL